MKNIAMLREVVVKVTQLLAGKGLTVTQQGASAYVKYDLKGNPIEVNIPHIPDDASDDLLMAIQGFIDHEVGHLLFTEAEWAAKQTKGNPKLRGLHNMAEDPLVEKLMAQKFPGSAYNVKRLHEFFLDKVTDKAIAKAKSDKEVIAYVLVPMVRALAGQEVFQAWMDARGYWTHPYIDALMNALPKDIRKRCESMKTTRDSLEVARLLETAMKEPPPPPPPPMPGEPCKDGDKSEGKPEKKDDKPKKSEEKKDDPDGEGSNKELPEDEDDKGSGGESSDEDDKSESTSKPKKDKKEKKDDVEDETAGESQPKGDDEESDDGDASDDDRRGEDDGDGEESSDDDGDGGDSGGGEDSDGDEDADGGSDEGSDESDGDGDSSDDEGDGDDDGDGKPVKGKPGDGSQKDLSDVEVKMDPFAEALQKEITDEATRQTRIAPYSVFTTDFDVIEPYPYKDGDISATAFEAFDEATRHMVGPMQKDIERMMATQAQVMKVPGFRSGRLHGAGLHKLSVGDDRVFRRMFMSKAKDTAVELVVDNSGSMYGSKMKMAMQTAYALAQTLERVKIPSEVIGFTTGHMTPVQTKRLRDEQKRIGKDFTRTETLYIPIYKSFEERFTPTVRHRFAKAINDHFLANNVDGESIMIGTTRLLKRKETRKVMIVLSDGKPAAATSDHKGLYAHVHKAVADATKAKIDVIGIGIDTDAVRTFYPKHIVLRDISSLATTVMGELKRILAL